MKRYEPDDVDDSIWFDGVNAKSLVLETITIDVFYYEFVVVLKSENDLREKRKQKKDRKKKRETKKRVGRRIR